MGEDNNDDYGTPEEDVPPSQTSRPHAVEKAQGDGRHVPLSDFTDQNQIWVSTSDGQGKAVDLAVAVQENGGGGGGGGSDLALDGRVASIRFNTLTNEWDNVGSAQPWLHLTTGALTLDDGLYSWTIVGDVTGPGYISVDTSPASSHLLEHYASYNAEGVTIPVVILGTALGGNAGQPTSTGASEFINMNIQRLIGSPITDDPIDDGSGNGDGDLLGGGGLL